ncbi:MAG: HEAT repeat domain-containing protein, partial [Myxococcota bacterium]
WGEILGPRAHEVLRRAQHDEDEAVRAAAAEASYFTPKEAVASLQAALMDESPAVRRAAARTIGRLGAEGVPLAARALGDADPTVLALACVSAGQLGRVELCERLKALTKHTDAAVVVAALEGLSLMGRLTEELLLRASLHADPEVLKLAFTLGADRLLLVPRAVGALEHARWDVRVAAARLLAVAGGRDALSPLQDAAAREDDPVASDVLASAIATLSRRL